MAEHRVVLDGCDGDTEVRIECSAAEVDFLLRLATAVNVAAVHSSCTPSLEIDGVRVGEPDIDENEDDA